MSQSKYVVGLAKAGYTERVVAIVFPEEVVHQDIAMAFFRNKDRLLGAGFCYVSDGVEGVPTMVATGKSESLNLKSRSEDAYYLNHALGLIEAVPSEIQHADQDKARAKIYAAGGRE